MSNALIKPENISPNAKDHLSVVRLLALVPSAEVEEAPESEISDPLPKTSNTPRDDEAHADLDREIKQCILDAGGNAESWEKYRVEKKLDEQTLGWKQSSVSYTHLGSPGCNRPACPANAPR